MTHHSSHLHTLFSPALTRRPLSTTWASLLIVLCGAVAGCASSGDRQQAELQKDSQTCQSFGIRQGTSEYSDCMLAQQRRRDTEKNAALERQRISTEIANKTQDTVRMVRCENEAKRDRERGERPRVCR